ncbi:MAG: hypothetical protein HYW08_14410 [candidate division NC10 bacterium]|nr:hypothetical protein [candidate division NC10 bacterium]
MIFEFWVWLLTTAAAMGVITLYGVATLKFRLGEEALEILALGVPFRTIRYEDIQSADLGGSLFNEHWVSFRLGNRITLHLRRGKRRAIVITPPDPGAFLLSLRSRLQNAPARDTD